MIDVEVKSPALFSLNGTPDDKFGHQGKSLQFHQVAVHRDFRHVLL